MFPLQNSYVVSVPLILFTLLTISTPFTHGGEPCICRGWVELSPVQPAPRSAAALVYDAQRGAAALIAGGGSGFLRDHWTWDGIAWQRIASMTNGRSDHAATYDRLRDRIVLFGGNQGLNATSEWDGETWLTGNTSTNPNQWPGEPMALLGRSKHAMAYDESAGWVLMLGGDSAFGLLPATLWGFDGEDWQELASEAGAPSRRVEHALAFDAARSETVLFGGSAGQYLRDTWVFSGEAWIQRLVPGPQARGRHAMAYDRTRGVTVLFGGGDGVATFGDTWEWNGVEWSQAQPSQSPSPRTNASMTFDDVRGVIVLHGGSNNATLGDLWEYDGIAWSLRTTTPPIAPHARDKLAMAYDSTRDRVVLHGGATNATALRDTWEWNPSNAIWQRLATAGPNIRYQPPGMAFDSARHLTVMYGSDVTWEWDGAAWAQRTDVGQVPADAGFGIAYDAHRGVVVLYGGAVYTPLSVGPPRDETWEYDGVAWTLQSPTAQAPALTNLAMSYDPVSQVVVMFGGRNLAGDFTDETWQYDGIEWTRVVVGGPSARQNARVAYDASIDALVLIGGDNASTVFQDAWRWNREARQWLPGPGVPPPGRTMFGLASLGSGRGLLTFGGASSTAFGDWSGEYWASGFVSACGDANCDGRTDAADAALFVAAQTGLSSYLSAGGSAECWSRRSSWLDVTQDGAFDAADAAALEAILIKGGCRGCVGDLDGDLSVGLPDLALLLRHFGTSAPEDIRGDLDADGDVDLNDLVALLSRFGAVC